MSGNYKIPTMKEISQIPWNGYNVVSTFSGGGGSCLGYEMAGYHVVWANEFIPEAQKTYILNHPNTFLATNDIRTVTPEQVIKESGIPKGEIDLFDGSPPCCAFSTAGSREKGWGKVKAYSDKEQRVDDLFFEYTRLLGELQPKTFVAENVKGLILGTAKGYFKKIYKALRDCGYEVSARLLNAEYLGVPQHRERLIFIGVRNDIAEKYDVHPAHPSPLQSVYTVGDALGDVKNDADEVEELNVRTKRMKLYDEILKQIPKDPKKVMRFYEFNKKGSYFNWARLSMYKTSPTIMASVTSYIHPLYDRFLTIEELKRISSVPDDFVVTGSYSQQWERLGRMVPPLMMKAIAEAVKTEVLDKIE